jgi:uncharacterized protein
VTTIQAATQVRIVGRDTDLTFSTAGRTYVVGDGHITLDQRPVTLDELVQDMLRPMLREWLDDNLPQLVERLVREEIQRVSRGRG